MYLRWLFYFAALVQVVFGLGFLLVPETLSASYAAKVDPTTIAVERYFGGTLLPLAWVSFVAARGGGSPLKLTLTRALEFVGIIDLIVTGLAMSSGVISTAGGIFNLAIGAIYTIGFGYYGWAKTDAALKAT